MDRYAHIHIAGGDTAEPINLIKRIQLIERVSPRGSRILDAGCGAGSYVSALCRRGFDAFGIEYSSDKVNDWLRLNPDDTRVRVGDIAALPFESESFDAVLLNEVLEHVPDEHRVLGEARRVLKGDGKLITFSPNRLYPFETHGTFLHSGERVSHVVPFVPWIPLPIASRFLRFWARNYWPWELRKRITAAGFSIESAEYVWQTFENISGHQPRLVTMLRPMLRLIAAKLEHTPILRAFGVSQLIIARPDQLRKS